MNKRLETRDSEQWTRNKGQGIRDKGLETRDQGISKNLLKLEIKNIKNHFKASLENNFFCDPLFRSWCDLHNQVCFSGWLSEQTEISSVTVRVD